MTFTLKELTRHGGDPVALYYFRWGAATNSFYAYTDAEHDIIAPGSVAGEYVTYTSAPIMRKSISSSGTLDKSTLEISVPRDLAVTTKFSAYPPSIVVSAVIRQGHLGETEGDYPACWVGRVVGFSFQGSEAILALEPLSTSMQRNGLRRNYQYSCPHVLFAAGSCNADKDAATTLVNITSASVNTIVMPASWYGSISVNKYLSGTVEWTNALGNLEIRTILQITSGKDLVLDGPTTGLTAGYQISAIVGCNRKSGIGGDTDGDCTYLHIESGGASPPVPNIKNFGGQPWIPFKNPMGSNTPYY